MAEPPGRAEVASSRAGQGRMGSAGKPGRAALPLAVGLRIVGAFDPGSEVVLRTAGAVLVQLAAVCRGPAGMFRVAGRLIG